MVGQRHFTPEGWQFFKDVADFLWEELECSVITPEAVTVFMWNRDKNSMPETSPHLLPNWHHDKNKLELILQLAERLRHLSSGGNTTCFSDDMHDLFNTIISRGESIIIENVRNLLVLRYLPERYPQFFEEWEITPEKSSCNSGRVAIHELQTGKLIFLSADDPRVTEYREMKRRYVLQDALDEKGWCAYAHLCQL